MTSGASKIIPVYNRRKLAVLLLLAVILLALAAYATTVWQCSSFGSLEIPQGICQALGVEPGNVLPYQPYQ